MILSTVPSTEIYFTFQFKLQCSKISGSLKKLIERASTVCFKKTALIRKKKKKRRRKLINPTAFKLTWVKKKNNMFSHYHTLPLLILATKMLQGFNFSHFKGLTKKKLHLSLESLFSILDPFIIFNTQCRRKKGKSKKRKKKKWRIFRHFLTFYLIRQSQT